MGWLRWPRHPVVTLWAYPLLFPSGWKRLKDILLISKQQTNLLFFSKHKQSVCAECLQSVQATNPHKILKSFSLKWMQVCQITSQCLPGSTLQHRLHCKNVTHSRPRQPRTFPCLAAGFTQLQLRHWNWQLMEFHLISLLNESCELSNKSRVEVNTGKCLNELFPVALLW